MDQSPDVKSSGHPGQWWGKSEEKFGEKPRIDMLVAVVGGEQMARQR